MGHRSVWRWVACTECCCQGTDAIRGRHLGFTLLGWCLHKDRRLLGQVGAASRSAWHPQLPALPDIKVQVIDPAPSLVLVPMTWWPLHPLPAPPLTLEDVPQR